MVAWRNLPTPVKIRRWISRGLSLRIAPDDLPDLPLSPVAPPPLRTAYSDATKQEVLLTQINTLKLKHCITPMSADEVGFFSRVFLVPKKNSNKWRLVIDLSHLNQFLINVPFQMDTLEVIKAASEQGMWATSLDLSDAYHHIPMSESAQKYLCFQIGDDRYKYLVLPFGLSIAPWAFTTLAKPLKDWARQQGIVMFQYLDDWIILARDPETLAEHTAAVVAKAQELGFLINTEKSELIPKQKITFLGEVLDLSQARAFPTQEKKQEIWQSLHRLLASRTIKLLRAESLLGLMSFVAPTIPLGRLHLRPFQAWVAQALIRYQRRDIALQVQDKVCQYLQWWVQPNIWAEGTRFRPPPHSAIIFTDASRTGWGISYRGRSWQGHWSRPTQHINWLELRTVLVALQILQLSLQNSTVLFLIDNTTAVAYINKQGGTRSRSLLKLARRILLLARQNQITITARHLAGHLNVLADLASRVGQVVATEWRLSQYLFQWVCSNSPWGPPTIDLFANSANHQLPRYGSPCPDQEAALIDALVAIWPQEVLYLFPPFSLMPQVLDRLHRETRIRCLLVAPLRATDSWLPSLRTIPWRSATALPLSRNMLRQPHWEMSHDNPSIFNLHLWVLQRDG